MINPLEDVLEKVGRVISDRYGIRVVCQGNRCCTDGKVIYLPALPDSVPPELMGAIRAFLDHEVGHIVGASDNELGGRLEVTKYSQGTLYRPRKSRPARDSVRPRISPKKQLRRS